MKLISFAIPCYNSAAYMRKCIESVLPGGDDVEIIIVDDGSIKDNTGDVWYTINFQEYRGADIYGVNTKIFDYTPRISEEYYYPAEGEDIIHLCQTVYGSSDAYRFFMQINGMANIELKAGQAYKVRR